MKRKMAIVITAALFLSGCGGEGNTTAHERTYVSESAAAEKEQSSSLEAAKEESGDWKVTEPQVQESSDLEAEESEEEVAFPGSYTVPEGWIKFDEYSTDEMIFYVEEGHEEDEFPDNISINVGTNQYSLKEHTKFRDAIVRQLLMQLEGGDAQLNGDGSHTAQDYMLYTFTIDEGDVVTRQYYIVKDYGFCLVHLTNFTGAESTYEAAQTIVDSFVWGAEN